MASQSLADLRFLFYGGGSASEYDFLSQAFTAGIKASNLLGGRELDYKENLTDVSIVQGGGTLDVPLLTITIPAQTTPWWIYFGGNLNNSLATGILQLRLQEGATQLNQIVHTSSAASETDDITKLHRMAPFVGVDRVFKLTLQALIATNVAHLVGAATEPAVIGAFK